MRDPRPDGAGPSVEKATVPGMTLALRQLDDADLDQLFEWERDPRAVAMAAFTRADPSDRAAFDDHHQRIRDDVDCLLLAIDHDGAFVGTIGSFTMDGEREVTYWIDRLDGAKVSARWRSKRSWGSRGRARSSPASPSTTSARRRCSPVWARACGRRDRLRRRRETRGRRAHLLPCVAPCTSRKRIADRVARSPSISCYGRRGCRTRSPRDRARPPRVARLGRCRLGGRPSPAAARPRRAGHAAGSLDVPGSSLS